MVADLTLQTAVERAGGAELTEKVTTASHGGSVAEAAATFPECFRYGRKSQSHVGNAVRSSQFAVRSVMVVMVVKRWVTLCGRNVLRKSKNVKVGRKSGSQSPNW